MTLAPRDAAARHGGANGGAFAGGGGGGVRRRGFGGGGRELIQANSAGDHRPLEARQARARTSSRTSSCPGTQLTFPQSQAKPDRRVSTASRPSRRASSSRGVHQEGTVPKIVAKLKAGGQRLTVTGRVRFQPTQAEQDKIRACVQKLVRADRAAAAAGRRAAPPAVRSRRRSRLGGAGGGAGRPRAAPGAAAAAASAGSTAARSPSACRRRSGTSAARSRRRSRRSSRSSTRRRRTSRARATRLPASTRREPAIGLVTPVARLEGPLLHRRRDERGAARRHLREPPGPEGRLDARPEQDELQGRRPRQAAARRADGRRLHPAAAAPEAREPEGARERRARPREVRHVGRQPCSRRSRSSIRTRRSRARRTWPTRSAARS